MLVHSRVPLLLALALTTLTATAKPPRTPVARKVYTERIADAAAFKAYSKQVGDVRFTKLVIDINKGSVLYFDVNVYKLHTDFVFAEIFKEKVSNERLIRFNENYTDNKPRFLLCYVTHHLQQDVWTLSFFSGDVVRDVHVAMALNVTAASFFRGKDLRFLPDSTQQAEVSRGMSGLRTISRDKLYKSAAFQTFTPGKAIGTLRIVRAGQDEPIFSPTDIVILPGDLPYITVVSGIITETFTTPLAHVALRARAWGIPHLGLKGAAARYATLDKRVVVFEATTRGHVLRAATAEETAAWKTARQAPKAVSIPAVDLETRALARLKTIRAVQVTAYGAKTANLGELAHGELPGMTVPAGFGIPVVWYAEHLQTHGLDKRIAALQASPRFRSDAAHRKASLAALRAAILRAPMDDALVSRITRGLKEIGAVSGRGVFVRSSTNAEDLPGFNGAGLYDTVPNVKGTRAVIDAVKRVWASVWNLRAWAEREHYRIDHRAVHGAVLVQIGVNATAAGVLVTTDIYNRESKFVYTINAKSGLGIRVVEGRKVPESILFDLANLSIKVISRSDEKTQLVFDPNGGVKEVPVPNPGKPVLTDERAHALALAAHNIVPLFGAGKPLDIEWLFEGDTLHVVQVRPFIR